MDVAFQAVASNLADAVATTTTTDPQPQSLDPLMGAAITAVAALVSVAPDASLNITASVSDVGKWAVVRVAVMRGEP